MITHLVCFKFKPDTPAADIEALAEGLGRLPAQIEEILEYRFGPDVIQSARSYDFGLVSRFEDLEALKRYQVHPEHQKVIAHVQAMTSSVVAVDFTE